MIAAGVLTAAEAAVARSVLYAAMFDYPLTLAQLRQTLIECRMTPTEILDIYERSETLRSIVGYRDGFFYPLDRADLAAERARREARSRAFLRRHRAFLRCVAAMPYVRMVALSGSIAHLNLERGGDLDLFIVTRGNRAWSVTVAVVMLAKLLRRRDVVCANYTVADARLRFDQQDLFTASQIINLRPIVGRDVLQRLLLENPFVGRFYPNFHEASTRALDLRCPPALLRAKRVIEWLLSVPSALAETVCRITYRHYLLRQSARWASPDQVTLDRDCLKLHTRSHRRAVLEKFERLVEGAIGAGEAAEQCSAADVARPADATPRSRPVPQAIELQ